MIADLQTRHLTVREAARVMNVSERGVYLAHELERTGRMDLYRAVESGTLSLHASLKIAKPEKYAKSTAPAQARNAWSKLIDDERLAFLDWIVESGT